MSATLAVGISAPTLPARRVGVGWRPEAGREILKNLESFDVIEVLSDTVIGRGERAWEEVHDLAEIVPIVLHGVDLSLASVDCLEHRSYLRELAKLVRELAVPFYSEHFALTKTRNGRIGHLSPVWLTKKQLAVLVRNVQAVQEMLRVPLVLENISVPYEIPGAEMSETDFINETVRRTGCKLLLDVENLVINAANLGFDPDVWLRRLDRASVAEIHLAGGMREGRLWVDTHSRPVSPDVWKLFRRAAASCPNLQYTIIERDEEFGNFSEIVAEAGRARREWRAAIKDIKGASTHE